MNPLYWKREHQIAFIVAVVFCGFIGLFIGVRQVEPSPNAYWLSVGLWGAAGAVMGAVGAFIRQLVRNRFSS